MTYETKTTCPECLCNWFGPLEEIIKVNSYCCKCLKKKVDSKKNSDSLSE